ncbi:hypothetical protein [Flavobacterium sp. JP2137]|uniref:hypothetical protein n=1 Tax=Flavobacterium sp. JP2137 TaxID=3414510 RepID=UPI003D2FAA85
MMRQQLAAVINTTIEKYGFQDSIAVVPEDLEIVEEEELVFWSTSAKPHPAKEQQLIVNDRLSALFDRSFTDRKSEETVFYHHLKLDQAVQVLKDREIAFESLEASKDKKEYLELYEQFHLFLPLGYSDGILLDRRKQVYRLPLRDNQGLKPLFNTADQQSDLRVALGFKIRNKQEKYAGIWDFRAVLYGEVKAFEMAREIQQHILEQFGKKFIVLGFDKYSRFYKNAAYSEEQEQRLCLDLTLFSNSFVELMGRKWEGCTSDVDKRELETVFIPFDNELFELELCELAFAPEVSPSQVAEVKKWIAKGIPVVA